MATYPYYRGSDAPGSTAPQAGQLVNGDAAPCMEVVVEGLQKHIAASQELLARIEAAIGVPMAGARLKSVQGADGNGLSARLRNSAEDVSDIAGRLEALLAAIASERR